jgi:ABC-type sulfate/molybdate transport systems ATPase subunit
MARVEKWFGKFKVLSGIDLDVQPGERIVVCGRSGYGKSTLIRCINRLETVQKGRIVGRLHRTRWDSRAASPTASSSSPAADRRAGAAGSVLRQSAPPEDAPVPGQILGSHHCKH